MINRMVSDMRFAYYGKGESRVEIINRGISTKGLPNILLKDFASATGIHKIELTADSKRSLPKDVLTGIISSLKSIFSLHPELKGSIYTLKVISSKPEEHNYPDPAKRTIDEIWRPVTPVTQSLPPLKIAVDRGRLIITMDGEIFSAANPAHQKMLADKIREAGK